MFIRRPEPARLAQNIMEKGYDIIGDSQFSSRGSSIFNFLHNHLNFNKIKSTKAVQFRLYASHFDQLNSPIISNLNYTNTELSELMGYPLRIHKDYAPYLLKKLRESNLILRYELADNHWTEPYQILCLPTGLYLNPKAINEISSLVLKALTPYTFSPCS